MVRVEITMPTSSPSKTQITPSWVGPPGTRKPVPPPVMHAYVYPSAVLVWRDDSSTVPPVDSAPAAAPWMIDSASAISG